MKRQYLGLDGQFSFLSSLGKTTLRAEGLIGTQPGIAGSSKSPNYSTRPENCRKILCLSAFPWLLLLFGTGYRRLSFLRRIEI